MSFSNETQGGVYGEYEKLSFQPEYLQRFQADEQLLAKLPEVLRKCVTGIQQNAAAILTSIDRFKALRAEAVHRGWPEHKARLAILNAKTTGRTLAAGAARAERAYSKESSGLSESWGSPVSTVSPLECWPEVGSTCATQTPPESPLSTRVDAPLQHPRVRRLTQTARSAGVAAGPIAINCDVPFQAVTNDSSPQSDPSSPLVSPESQGFDEPAWEFYISTLEAEREFLQRQLMVDMQHRIHEFKKLCYELGEHLPPSFSWERRRASSNGDLGSECPPPCDFLYHTLGREERARFNSWWEMDIVAWFLVTRRECSEFGIPTVEEAVNERKDMKLTVSS
ncbi:hypothetical protein EV356DRAFT_531640 [Viridothelium virens]|uniref:Uncharacterized protein n=1 Tax=Viridothelium virens TaxID=1048519 RepID=A0A6A6HD88_VIRVR|nr:hypothetical protein EV356DRAFT_531640 [Viridothelium virens]